MKKSLLLIVFLLNTIFLQAEKNENINILDSLTVNQLEKLDFSHLSINKYISLTKYAIQLTNNANNDKDLFKGQVLLSIISDKIDEDINNCNLNPITKEVKNLLKIYEKEGFFIYQPKINDFLKLSYYMCDGQYDYIYKRVSAVPFFSLSLTLFIIAIFTIFTRLYKRNKRRLFVAQLTLIVVAAIFISLFKFTCHENIKKDSIYGINAEHNPCPSTK